MLLQILSLSSYGTNSIYKPVRFALEKLLNSNTLIDSSIVIEVSIVCNSPRRAHHSPATRDMCTAGACCARCKEGGTAAMCLAC